MKTVVLLSTRRLPPAYFDTVREDLGGDPDLVLDVIGWVGPDGPVEDKVNSFTLIGPGRMPAASPSEPEPEPAPALKPGPTGSKRGVRAALWRARRSAGRVLPEAIKKGAKFLRSNRAGQKLGKTYWDRVLSRPDVMSTIEKADVVVALDSGAIWAGWNLGRRRPGTPVVLGLPAARRELDQLKAPAGNG